MADKFIAVLTVKINVCKFARNSILLFLTELVSIRNHQRSNKGSLTGHYGAVVKRALRPTDGGVRTMARGRGAKAQPAAIDLLLTVEAQINSCLLDIMD